MNTKTLFIRMTIALATLALFAVFTNLNFVKQFATATLGIGQTLSTGNSLEEGLVGHWTFDGPDVDWGDTTTEIKDVSGNSNHGDAQNGMSERSPVLGTIGQGMSFDGVLNNVSLGTPAIFDLDTVENFTFSIWVQAQTVDGTRKGIWGTQTAAPMWGLMIDGTTNKFRFFRIGSDGNEVFSSMVVTAGQWYHVVVVGTNYGGTKTFYIDGVENNSTVNTPDFGRVLSNVDFAKYNAGNQGDVSLDDARFYHRALTAEEIQRLYKLGEGVKIATTPSGGTLDDGLVGHWTFDGEDMDLASTSAEVRDRSGYDKHGDWENHESLLAAGVIGQSIYFDGSDDRINADSGSTSNWDDTTYCAWVNPTDVSSLHEIISRSWVGTGEDEVILRINNGTFRVADGNGERHTSLETVSVGEWKHVCMIFLDTGGSTADYTFYVNGVFDSTINTTYNPNAFGGINRLKIGVQWDGNGRRFAGYMDDVRIYDRMLSAKEIASLYQMGEGAKISTTVKSPSSPLEQGLVGHWTFDGGDIRWQDTGTEVKDVSGNDNHGEAQGVIGVKSPMIGAIGQALKFEDDGSDSCVVVPDDSTIQDLGPMSVSMWIKKVGDWGMGNNDAFISKTYNQTQGWRFRIGDFVGVPDKVAFTAIYDGSGVYRISSDLTDLHDGDWHLLAVTWDGTTTGSGIHIYLDGVEVSYSNTADGSGSYVSDATRGLALGGATLGCSNDSFSEAMDDVRLYNRALSAKEVQMLYQLGR